MTIDADELQQTGRAGTEDCSVQHSVERTPVALFFFCCNFFPSPCYVSSYLPTFSLLLLFLPPLLFQILCFLFFPQSFFGYLGELNTSLTLRCGLDRLVFVGGSNLLLHIHRLLLDGIHGWQRRLHEAAPFGRDWTEGGCGGRRARLRCSASWSSGDSMKRMEEAAAEEEGGGDGSMKRLEREEAAEGRRRRPEREEEAGPAGEGGGSGAGRRRRRPQCAGGGRSGWAFGSSVFQ